MKKIDPTTLYPHQVELFDHPPEITPNVIAAMTARGLLTSPGRIFPRGTPAGDVVPHRQLQRLLARTAPPFVGILDARNMINIEVTRGDGWRRPVLLPLVRYLDKLERARITEQLKGYGIEI